MAKWCSDNNLRLNTVKTKEFIVDFKRRRGNTHTPVHINGTLVEWVTSFNFLGILLILLVIFLLRIAACPHRVNSGLPACLPALGSQLRVLGLLVLKGTLHFLL